MTISIDPNSGLWGPLNWTLSGILVPIAIGVIFFWLRSSYSRGFGVSAFAHLVCKASFWVMAASRASHVTEYSQYYMDAPHRMFYIWAGGYDLWGALIGLGGFVFVSTRHIGVARLQFLQDTLFATAVILICAGMFQWLLGTVPGTSSGLPWAVNYSTESSVAFANGEQVHPVGLYRATLAILVGSVAWAYSRAKGSTPMLAPIMVGAYAFGSIGIGFVLPGRVVLGMGISQWCACFALLSSIAWSAKTLRTTRPTEVE